MTPPTLSDQDLATLRPLLVGHCYRMLGSPFDADDAVQETLLRAHRARAGFAGRASVKTWLLRIATNVCLDEIARRKRSRERPTNAPAGRATDALGMRPPEEWIEPVPDAWVVPQGVDPHEALERRQSVRLAFVAALQQLPAKQRAALLLTEVLGLSAVEAADTLETTVPALNSALQRARKGMGEPPAERIPDQAVLARYVDAFERWDVGAMTQVLADDVRFCMPPIALWLDSSREVARFLTEGPGAGCAGSRLVPIEANGTPAFAHYKADGTGWGIVVLGTRDGAIVEVDTFLDVERLFPLFGLPTRWDEKIAPGAMSSADEPSPSP